MRPWRGDQGLRMCPQHGGCGTKHAWGGAQWDAMYVRACGDAGGGSGLSMPKGVERSSSATKFRSGGSGVTW